VSPSCSSRTRCPSTETPTTKNEPTSHRDRPTKRPVPARISSSGTPRRFHLALDRLRHARTVGDVQRPRRRAALGAVARGHLARHPFTCCCFSPLRGSEVCSQGSAVIDPFDAIKQRKDLSYLDCHRALRELQPKVKIKPLPEKQKQIDKQTLEAMNKPAPAPAPEKQPEFRILSSPNRRRHPPTQSLSEAPRRRRFRPGPTLPWAPRIQPTNCVMRCVEPRATKVRRWRRAIRWPAGLPMHPAREVAFRFSPIRRAWTSTPGWRAGTGRRNAPGSLLPRSIRSLKREWLSFASRSCLMGGSWNPTACFLEGRSGDTALDRAAWGAITGSIILLCLENSMGRSWKLRAYFSIT